MGKIKNVKVCHVCSGLGRNDITNKPCLKCGGTGRIK